jgi:hypothetical protein
MQDRSSLCIASLTAGRRVSRYPATPDFLSMLVALPNFTRLSSRKGAHAALSSAALQEIRAKSRGTLSASS